MTSSLLTEEEKRFVFRKLFTSSVLIDRGRKLSKIIGQGFWYLQAPTKDYLLRMDPKKCVYIPVNNMHLFIPEIDQKVVRTLRLDPTKNMAIALAYGTSTGKGTYTWTNIKLPTKKNETTTSSRR